MQTDIREHLSTLPLDKLPGDDYNDNHTRNVESRHAQLHTIALSIDFAAVPQSEGRSCPHCNTPLRNTYIEHIFGWGDTERLECAVKDTPVLQCGCGTSIEGHVLQRIKEKGHLVLRAIESEDESAFGLLTSFLDEEDISKVRDFTFNRRVPYPRSRPHLPTPALTSDTQIS